MTPSRKDWLFVSDAHFTGDEPEPMDAFLRFLDSESEGVAHLVILGDLFDFLFGFKDSSQPVSLRPSPKCFPFPEYLPVFDKLHRLSLQGIRIQYFEGNHDFFLHSFFEDWFRMKVEVYPNGKEERLGGRRSFLAHGDLSNPGQWKYRLFRRMVKNRWVYHLIHWIGPRRSRQIALKMSRTSHQIYHINRKQSQASSFQSFARERFLEGYEIVILAHLHQPAEFEEVIDGRRCVYFNVGDWVTHRSYLRFSPPDGFELKRFYHDGQVQ